MIPSGPPSHRAADVIGPRMADLVDEFAKEYDLIILDAPPLLGFAEPLQMATAADGVLIVSRAGETKRKAVAGVISALSRLRANVIGVVLNQVKKNTSDGYSYYGYYEPVLLQQPRILILQSSTMGNGGEIFVLDMGAPVRIVDLARNLILLSGLRPDQDIQIKFTGSRPGEKLYEELNTHDENILPTHHEKVKIFAGTTIPRDLMEKVPGPDPNRLHGAQPGRPRPDSQRPDPRIQPQRPTPTPGSPAQRILDGPLRQVNR